MTEIIDGNATFVVRKNATKDDKTAYPNSINNDTVGLYLNNVTIAFT